MAQPVSILDLIYELESSSGKNPKAYKPNEYGALGGYQLRPGAFADLRRAHPKKWGAQKFENVAMNDGLARQAANDYIQLISQYLVQQNVVPTRDALLAGYHSGMGNTARGTIGPKGMKYLSRTKALAGVSPEYTAPPVGR